MADRSRSGFCSAAWRSFSQSTMSFCRSLTRDCRFLFSLAQLGGIPRPRPIDRAGVQREGNRLHEWLRSRGISSEFVFWDWVGLIFWFAWMMTQLSQLLVVSMSLAMQVVSFFGVRARLAPCLVAVDGATLFDDYALTTFATQPALLSKLLLLVTYSYLLSPTLTCSDPL